MNKPLRLGCIGGGMIMNVAHLPAYIELRKQVIITAIYASDIDTAHLTRDHYLKEMEEAGATVDWDVTVCADPEELYRLVDVVDIATPTRSHAYYAEQALSRGIHAMSEKPIARNWLEADRLARVAAQSGALYQLNDDNVFLPRYQHIKNIIASGAIGRPNYIVLPRGTHSSGRNSWFFDPISGGGAILDYGSHAVMGAWFLLGVDKTPHSVISTGIRVKDRTRFICGELTDIETDDDAHFKVLFRDPANGDFITAMLEATWACPDFADNASDARGYIRVEGTEGYLTSIFDEQDREFIRICGLAGGERLVPIQSYRSETLSFRDEIANFLCCIRGGRQSMIDAARGAVTMQIIGAAQLSELRGRVNVGLDEIPPYMTGFGDAGGDIQAVGDAIALELTKPYRLPQKI